MSAFPMGILVEGSVSILLLVTIGYCVVLNGRLKRLHQDRESLKVMIADLVQATDLANSAVKELKQTAVEVDLALNGRLEEAERFELELANHIQAGTSLMDRIAKITSAAKGNAQPEPVARGGSTEKVQSALQQLAMRPRMRGNAA